MNIGYSFDSALLLAFENGTKVSFSASAGDNFLSSATASLTRILDATTNGVEPFTIGTRAIDFDYFSPLVTFLVYKAAVITTERLSMELYDNDALARLRTLRKFLRITAKRWLCCGELNGLLRDFCILTERCEERYLKLLDEDTTPRMLKAIEQRPGMF